MITLSNFPQPELSGNSRQLPAPRTESVPLDATRPILRNFPLVWQLIQEAFTKSDRTVLLLTSNGTEDKTATEYYLRRVVA